MRFKQTLFFKIFGWFWVAMALIIFSVFLVTWLTLRSQTPGEMRHPSTIFAHQVARVYEREGANELATQLSFLDQQLLASTYLFDEQGNDLAGRPVTEAVKTAFKRIADKKIPAGLSPPIEPGFQAVSVKGPSGRINLFVIERFGPPPGRLWATTNALALQIAAILLSAGLGCYLLARYLIAPITQLRTATRKLANGDWSTRVSPAMGKRRDEVSDLGTDFDRMAAQIESLILAQRRLLGDISHELRSPLTRLNLALGVARRHAAPAATKALDHIEREADRLNELIGQLLTLTRLESGEELARREPVNLAELIHSVADDAAFGANNLNRTVQVNAAAHCTVNGIEWLLRSAIENVVRNAIRHTADATVVEISLSCQPAKPLPVTIIVSDHGPGVPTETLTELFRAFYRVDDARDRHSGGSGLGLSITERAIKLHGGTVQASNAPEGGLLVTMCLPLTQTILPNQPTLPDWEV